MSSSVESPVIGFAVLPSKGASMESDRTVARPFCVRCRAALESLSGELFILLCVVLLLPIITVQFLLDAQLLTVSNSSVACTNWSIAAIDSQSLEALYSVTAQFQYAVSALGVLFFVESVLRAALVRSDLLRSKCAAFVNLLDLAVCSLFCATSITFTVLTYYRAANSFVRDSVNFLVAVRLVRIALIAQGATSRSHVELREQLKNKRGECAYLTEHAVRLERRVRELEKWPKGSPFGDFADTSGQLTTTGTQASSNAVSNGGFLDDCDQEEPNCDKETSSISLGQFNKEKPSSAATSPQASLENIAGDNANDADNGTELTPEAQAVIQRLYELGLEWEADDNEDNCDDSEKRAKAIAAGAELPDYFSNMPTTTL